MNKKENNLVQKRKKIMLGAFFVLTFISGWVFGHQDAQFSKVGFTPTVLERGTSKSSVDFSVFWRTWEIIEKNYDGKLDYQKMVDGAIKGMVDAIGDPYTNYLSAEDAKQLQDDLSGVVSGIGAEVGIRDNKLIIVAPIEDSPAKNAGLAAGDYIVKINNEITAGMDINAAVAKIRGQEGTKVTLTINRGGQEKNYEITRKKITVKSVKSEIKNKNIGYISVNRFDINTTEEIRAAIVDFKAKGVKKLILDVRDNPGGYLDESVSTSSLFIKEGIIVTEKKDVLLGKKNEYKASGNGPAIDNDIKIVVLINSGSASASEIVAGALKDHNRAILVGEKTYGKGSVQEIESLSKGAKLKITVAHWYTPNGLNIGKSGIEPNIKVGLTEADYNAGRDPQLNKAIEILNK